MQKIITNDEVKGLEKEIMPYIKKAEAMTAISNAGDMAIVSELRVNLKNYAKSVKERKDFVLKPFLEGVKNFRQMVRPLEERVATQLDKVDMMMSTYQTEQKRIADAEAAKIAARVGEGKGKLKIDTAVRKMEEIEKPEEKVVSESGATKFITVAKFRVMDITLLPAEYLLADEVKIRRAMLAGIKIAGVDYYTEERPRNS